MLRSCLLVLACAACNRSEEHAAPHPAVTVIKSTDDASVPVADAHAPIADSAADTAPSDTPFPAMKLSRAAFMAAVARELPASKKRCLSLAVPSTPGELEVDVDPSGSVRGVRVLTVPARHPVFCFRSEILRWKFPETFGGGTHTLRVP